MISFMGLCGARGLLFRIGLTVAILSSVIGVLLGGIGAFLGGLLDSIVIRILDLLMSFPFLIAVIIMTVIFGKSIEIIIISMVLFGWRNFARLIRSEILSVKERDFVIASHSLGASWSRVFFRHVLPNSIFPVFVIASMDIGRNVLLASSLSFTVGSEPWFADWGQMINFSRNWLFDILHPQLRGSR